MSIVDDDSNLISAIFGLNGSGKTNIITCVKSIKDLLLAKTNVEEFLSNLNRDHELPETVNFGMTFDAYGKVYRYEATLNVNRKRFVSESLWSTFDGETHSVLETVGAGCKLNPVGTDSVRPIFCPFGKKTALAKFFDGFPERLTSKEFISKHGDGYEGALQELIYFTEWFKSLLSVINTDSILPDVEIKSLTALLQSMDLDLKPEIVEAADDDDVIRWIRSMTVDKMSWESQEFSKYGVSNKTWILSFDSKTYYAELKGGELSIHTLEFRNSSGPIAQNMLSAGQSRLVELSPMIACQADPILENDHVYIVDEIDRKLHTNLTLQLIRLFLEKEGHRQQLIFTTHETELIDSGFADISNMWITDRTKGEGSFLYYFPRTGLFEDPKTKFIENDLIGGE